MFMKEEEAILRKVGTRNPFTVPEGYFEGLTSDVMNALPAKENGVELQKEPTWWDKVKPWAYMAAMFAGAALLIRVGSVGNSPSGPQLAAEEAEQEMEYIHSVVDNSMLDDYELYVYLSDTDMEP